MLTSRHMETVQCHDEDSGRQDKVSQYEAQKDNAAVAYRCRIAIDAAQPLRAHERGRERQNQQNKSPVPWSNYDCSDHANRTYHRFQASGIARRALIFLNSLLQCLRAAYLCRK